MDTYERINNTLKSMHDEIRNRSIDNINDLREIKKDIEKTKVVSVATILICAVIIIITLMLVISFFLPKILFSIAFL